MKLATIIMIRRRLNAEARVRTGANATRPLPHYPAPVAWLNKGA